MIVLNLKTYPESIEKALLFTDIARDIVEETGIRVVVCPPMLFLREAAERFGDIFSQHADAEPAGAHTGSVPAELIKAAKAKGSLVNHSERKVAPERIKQVIEQLHRNNLDSLVCAATSAEAVNIAHSSPTYIAVEPPELIGSGVSVSTAKPEIVINSVKAVMEVNHKVTVLCGAGVSTKEDVKKALELGAQGVLLASAFVKAPDPKAFLSDLASAY
ncbi:MAG TPA: triose-phosphate isomerase [Candidatus Bilamarchaeum sp.]|nr:triose-phosphate isomerase [Candidatus Bilamarchaeum sp.]